MRKHVILLTAGLASIMLFSCVGMAPLSRGDVDELFKSGNEKALARAVSAPDSFDSPEVAKYADGRLKLLRTERANSAVSAALAAKDESTIEKAANGSFDPYLDAKLKVQSKAVLLDLRRAKQETRIVALSREPDLPALAALLSDAAIAADPKLTAMIKRVLAAYATSDPKLEAYRGVEIERAFRDLNPALSKAAREEPTKALQPLVLALLKNEIDPFRKVKSLHDWITYHIAYDTDTFFNGTPNAQDYAAVLKRGTAVCGGYSALFQEMARLGGIESRIITGFAKGYGWQGETESSLAHAWNQACINGFWYSIDCTWDAGKISYRRYNRRYSTEYLFLSPREFAYTHLPTESRHQLLVEPLSKEVFAREPKLTGEFFRLGFSPIDRIDGRIETQGEWKLSLSSRKQRVRLAATLAGADINQFGTEDAIVIRKGGLMELRVSPPKSGRYKASLFAASVDEPALPDSIPSTYFEKLVMVELDALIEAKKATAKEKELFIRAFELDQDTDSYYYLEDRLDPAKAALVGGVFRKVSLRSSWFPSIMQVDLDCRVDSPLKGYPIQYSEYDGRTDFKLIEPVDGLLEAGKEYRFAIDCPSAPEIAIIQGGDWQRLKRNGKGIFEASLQPVPGLPLEIAIPSSDKRYYTALQYQVIE